MNEEPLHLLLELEDERTRARWRESVFISLIVHMLVIITVLVEPKFFRNMRRPVVPEAAKPKQQITFLSEPPDILKPKIKPQTPVLSDQDRLAHPGLEAPRLPPVPPSEPLAPKPKPPGEGQQLAQAIPPPKGPGPGESPKLGDVPAESPKLTLPPAASPGKSMEETLRGIARNRAGGGGEVVFDPGQGRIDSRNPAAIGGAQILSDTMGVDFNPYLQRILWDIKRNWYAVMPEIARMGKRGRVILQFEILKDGSVPKLYLTGSSASEPLDKAALAGIVASVPFQPLPPEFRGPLLRLQITFLYNIPLDAP